MSKLYISEFTTIPIVPTHAAQVPIDPPLAEQVLDFTLGVQTSAPFQQHTRLIRLHADAVCSLIINRADANPVATILNGRWAANQTEYRGVREGENFVVSVIANT